MYSGIFRFGPYGPADSTEDENMFTSNGHQYYKTAYLPHHAVIKESSSTTKLRVVFDASRKTTSGISLNQSMLTGPTIQQDIISILIRWRKYQVVFTADVEKMYRQIQVRDSDADYQRIVWRSDPSQPIRDYKLTTVTFGTSGAPYLAIRTLQQLARDGMKQFPNAAAIALRDFYVDDLLSGCDTINEAIQLQDEIKRLMKKGGSDIRKWTSNRVELLEKNSEADREIHPYDFDKIEGVKRLDNSRICLKIHSDIPLIPQNWEQTKS